jgi:undecaprenyl-diphosphatase
LLDVGNMVFVLSILRQMIIFDAAIIEFLNQFSRQWWAVDVTIVFLSSNHLVKGGLLMLIFWWGWFRTDTNQVYVRAHLVSTLISCFIAMLLARVLSLLLPFRFRPLHEVGSDFQLPYGIAPRMLESWSSFPSDHAVLFFALSAGLFSISRRVGFFALAYTTLLIGLPRIYLGLHYASDIIGGAVIGVIIAFLCNRNSFTEKLSQPVSNLANTRPELFYPGLFLVTYQIADMFISGRAFAAYVWTII